MPSSKENMEITSVLKLIGTSESMKIEWKPSLSQINEIIESVTAFANTEGGRLFVGVAKDGKLDTGNIEGNA